jgi:flagellar assembly factor FliW
MMKVLTESPSFGSGQLNIDEFTLPHGIVGFPGYTRAELLRDQDGHPFMRMRLLDGEECINFVVMEPGGLIPGYDPELFENDAASLELADSSEAMILTILTMRPGTPEEATVNLIGPIVINRRTRVGRQLVIANYSLYRARHPLIAPSRSALASS